MAEDTTTNDEQQGDGAGPEIEGGAYEIIRARLVEQSKGLGSKASKLNERRIEVFGGIEMKVLGNERIRTENNCIPRDIVQVGGQLLFGYNVFIGLKKEIKVGDVFSVQQFREDGDHYEFHTTPLEQIPWLSDEKFVKDFTELYAYYKDARLVQLRRVGARLLAVFQITERIDDIKAFRWAVSPDGDVTYIDNRGEEDHVFPATHDFEWVVTGREQFTLGTHPHVNILDEVFVETVGGDLTVKVEDNSEDGEGIYAEPVEDKHQSLDDGQIHYAKVGALILLKILPYREEQWRYLIYNTRTKGVKRVDNIGQACVQLPEDHGIIFPGGYYLQSGETKTFDGDTSGLRFLRVIKSPNGEDVMYAFYHEEDGTQTLLPYNLIRKEVENPIHCHGSTIFDDGKMVVFKAEEEPTRVHHTRIWQTAFMSDEVAAEMNASSEHAGSFLVKVGNADLVRGISDCQSIRRAIANQQPSMAIYEDLINFCQRTIDSYHWLDNDEVGNLLASVNEVKSTAELVIDEFEKVLTIKKAAEKALAEAEELQDKLFDEIRPDLWETVDSFVDAMARLRTQRGHLITLREMRYMNTERVDELEGAVSTKFDELSEQATQFLLGDDALKPYHDRNDELMAEIEVMEQANQSEPITERLDTTTQGLDVLTEVISGLKMDDPTARTTILEGISEIFGLLNRTRATLVAKRKSLMHDEGVAEFGAQFKLFGQSVQSALGVADSPEKCDEQLTRLMVQLEELEAKFSEFDQFLGDLAQKREEVYEAFSGKKQTLLEERQRRASNLAGAAERILQGVGRRAQTFKELDELNAYFAADAMVMKVRDIAEQLTELNDTVKSDEILSNLKKARDDASRQLRDKTELFAEGDNIIRLGKHLFSVNTQPLELTIVPRDGDLYMHLTGTGYFEKADDERLEQLRRYWDQALVSEDKEVYRGEYLAASILFDADEGNKGLTLDKLHDAMRDEDSGGLLGLVRTYAQERYDEGYDRGVHDSDAAAILEKLLGLYATAGLLRFAPDARAAAVLFWTHYDRSDDKAVAEQRAEDKDLWWRKARSLGRLRSAISHSPAIAVFVGQLEKAMKRFLDDNHIPYLEHDLAIAASYLFEELGKDQVRFATSAEADALKTAFFAEMEAEGHRATFDDDLRELEGDLRERFNLTHAWLEAFVAGSDDDAIQALAPVSTEAIVLILTGPGDRDLTGAVSSMEVDGLLGNHANVEQQKLTVRLDEFLSRLRVYQNVHVPNFHKLKEVRQQVADETRNKLRLEEFKPRVLSSFVRNKLINDVYLPMVGDNLAKQMGAVGDNKRTDLMGLLLLISPPGYGKTTLMEYIANRLGLVFMKVNGPSLGHEVTSLDPSEAPNATARQEVEKINLAFEMGNNVMLYLDDIQHTHPELLQKFISLCDGTRRIEGVWDGKTRTYDLRGKKFCVVMAGNPYTETGEKFRIPDMLANRADTYNLGDVLGGKEDVFALSYIENAMTSNPVLQPLATREQSDIYLFVRQAQGEEINTSDFKHGYSGVEAEEIVNVFKKMLVCQDVLLKVNLEYIRSAAQDDKYRVEPSFKLQGSYRNMNKLAEKIVAVMNEEELEVLIDDHYQGESQTLTTGAEMNLLKLQEMRNRLSEEEAERWEEIKKDFRRQKMMGGDDGDPVGRMTSTLAGLGQQLETIGEVLEARVSEANANNLESASAQAKLVTAGLKQLGASLEKAAGQAAGASQTAQKESADALQFQAQQLAAELSGLRASLDTAAKASAQSQLNALKAEMQHRKQETEALMAHERQQHETELKLEVERFKADQQRDDQRLQAMLTELSNLRQQLTAAATQAGQGLSHLANAQMRVEVTAPPPPGVDKVLLHQAKLLEGTLVPLLQAIAKGSVAAGGGGGSGPPVQVAGGGAAADASTLHEALAILKDMQQQIGAGAAKSGGVYRPYAPRPLGTRAEED